MLHVTSACCRCCCCCYRLLVPCGTCSFSRRNEPPALSAASGPGEGNSQAGINCCAKRTQLRTPPPEEFSSFLSLSSPSRSPVLLAPPFLIFVPVCLSTYFPRWAVPAAVLHPPRGGSSHLPCGSFLGGGGSGSSSNSSTVRVTAVKSGCFCLDRFPSLDGQRTSLKRLFLTRKLSRFLFHRTFRHTYPTSLLLQTSFRCPGRDPTRPSVAEASGFQHCSAPPVPTQRRSPKVKISGAR